MEGLEHTYEEYCNLSDEEREQIRLKTLDKFKAMAERMREDTIKQNEWDRKYVDFGGRVLVRPAEKL